LTTGLPTGRVTFLLTDVEGSTPAWERDPEGMVVAMAAHDRIVAEVVTRRGGALPVEQGEGDNAVAAFARPADAVEAAWEIQRTLLAEWPWLRVRMAIHTGEVALVGQVYRGVTLSRCARVRGLARGGQVLLTAAAVAGAGELPPSFSVRSLGSHRLKGLAEPERVYQLLAPGLPDDFPALAPYPLPPAPPLVGRDVEVERVAALLAEPSPVVTLTGPGGSGKTALALAVAARAGEAYPDGQVFVDLSGVPSPEHVLPAVCAALRVPEDSEPVEFLADRCLLLVVDNVEHLLAAAPALAGLAGAGPGVRLLATSRAPLRVPGERVVAVGGLDLPPATATTAAEVLASPAGRLFADRVAAARAGWRCTDDDAAAVAGVVRLLDGLPLGIELAAARAMLLSPAELLARLPGRIDLLAGGGNLPERHRSIRAMLDWSHDLLDPGARTLLRRLSVFPGGCDLAMAEELCAGEGIDVLSALAALADSSLVRVGDRVTMLETVRAYAAERLAEAGEDDAVHGRFVDVVLRRLAAVAPMWGGSQDAAPVDPEVPNVHGVLAWCAAAGRWDDVATAFHLMRAYWPMRGRVADARPWWDLLTAHRDDLSPENRAAVEVDGVALSFPVDADLGQAIEVFASRGAWLEAGRAAYFAAYHASFAHDDAAALAYAERAIELTTAAGNAAGRGMSLNLRALLVQNSDPEGALRDTLEFVASTREGTSLHLAALSCLVEAYLVAGRLDDAHATLPALRAAAGRVTDARRLGDVERSEALVALREGRLDDAEEWSAAEVAIVAETDPSYPRTMTVQVRVAVLAARGDDVLAARLLGAADALGERFGTERVAAVREELEALRAKVSGPLAEPYAEGRGLDWPAALTLALRGQSPL
jgi:predicted ATPase/class 3 adenylate cyclase